jgi:hypothetical protein
VSVTAENPLVYFDDEERLGHVLDGWVSACGTRMEVFLHRTEPLLT